MTRAAPRQGADLNSGVYGTPPTGDTMIPYYEDGSATLYLADCREMLATIPENSVDSIVTDPPYELGFMGKKWDASGIAYDPAVWREALRVLKPGGHLLAFSGSRTYHRMVCAIEDAGFEVRDMIEWIYGSGFPKSLNVSKAILSLNYDPGYDHNGDTLMCENCGEIPSTIDNLGTGYCAECAAKEWEGWGTALKPAHEPICMARKPPIGTVAANLLLHGTGAINVDACRVSLGNDKPYSYPNGRGGEGCFGIESLSQNLDIPMEGNTLGRWPANLIHDGSDEVVSLFPNSKSTGGKGAASGLLDNESVYGKYSGENKGATAGGLGDTGSNARFFYCAKASKADREEGLDHLPVRSGGEATDRVDGSDGLNSPRAGAGRLGGRRNTHPTVKPTDLMRYLCRLVTPPGGTVLDFFAGSGSTGKAAMLEGFKFIGCDMTPEYMPIMQARITAAKK